jgi:poly(3-hydroxybutyrate) depolymerase
LQDTVLYRLHEFHRSLLSPVTHMAQLGAHLFSAPGSWLAQLPGASRVAAGYELLYRLGKNYSKPEFGIPWVEVDGATVAVIERTELARPFCRLQRFQRCSDQPGVIQKLKRDPAVLVVAPLSGHHATLLRDTVTTLLPSHDVYVTDWLDARMVPTTEGAFTLDDYVAYISDFIQHLGASRLHVISVCQATVPVLAAVALAASAGEPSPRSLVMMGGPIDARCSPTPLNNLATGKSLDWFESHLITTVPPGYPGDGRRVYPGFLQHTGFIAMNPGHHMSSHWKFYENLVQGDLETAQAHRRFYDEYNAVLDLSADYYLDCIRVVFQEHLLPRGLWHVGGRRVAPEALRSPALLSIEGELDDISGAGQTRAVHELCRGISGHRKRHVTVEGVGHYGIFSGRRWREVVYPQVREFIAQASKSKAASPPRSARSGRRGTAATPRRGGRRT